MNIISQSISQILVKTQRAFRERNWGDLIDVIIVFLFISSITFILSYKGLRLFETFVFHSTKFLLPDNIKNSLPQIFFFVVLFLGMAKWVLNIKGNRKIQSFRDPEPARYGIKIGKYNLSISKQSFSFLLLILIFFVFTIIKIPAWDTSFTVNHPMKYNTYVEPALNMLEQNDPFFLQRKYMNNPLTNSKGLGLSFGNLPALEWFLFTSFKIFEKILPFEITTRLAMNFLGIFTLTSFYMLIKKIFHRKVSLIATFLFAINPIFNLASFVTVYDTLTLGLSFISFNFLFKFFKEEKPQLFFISALILGTAASIKENIAIWALPIIAVLLIAQSKYLFKDVIKKISIYLIYLVIPYLTTILSVSYFPEKKILHFVLFLVFLAVTILVYSKILTVQDFLERIFEKFISFICKYKYLLLLILPLFIFIIKMIYSTELAEEFLTDERLILNIDLYLRLIYIQLIPYSTIFLFLSASISVFLLIFYENAPKKNFFILAMLIGSIVYVIVASKVLFFHSYYWIPILSLVVLLASWGISFLANLFESKEIRLLFMFLILMGMFIPMTWLTSGKLNRENTAIYSLIGYFNGLDLDEETTFIDQSSLTYLTLKTDLYRLYDTKVFANPIFKESVRDIGFTSTMHKYKIEYLITENINGPDYTIFANSFSISELQSTSYRRTDQIYQELYPGKFSYYTDGKLRDQIFEGFFC